MKKVDAAADHETQPTSSREASFIELFIVIGHRKRFILLWAVGLAVLGVVISLVMTPTFTATTVVLPPKQDSSFGGLLMGELGGLGSLASIGGFGLKNQTDTYVALIKSQNVEDAIVRRFDLQRLYKTKLFSDARKRLESNSEIEADKKDGLIRISVTDTSKERAADIANSYVEEYRKLSANLAITEAARRRLFFEQQLVQAKDNLASAEESLKRTQQNTGVIELDSQARALISSVANIRAQIAARQVRIEAMSASSTSSNPEMILAQEELSALKTELKRLTGSEDPTADLIVPKGKVPEAGLEYLRKLRDVKYNEAVFQILAKQFEIAKLDEAREGSIIQVVYVAVPPDRKSSPHRTLIVLSMFVLGLVGGSFWVLVQSAVADYEKNPEQSLQLALLRGAWGLRR